VIDVGPASDSDPIGTAAPRTFVVNEGPCHGDSGGPAISEETGALLGVYSLAAASSCTSVGARNVFTRLAPFSSLILGTFDQIGVEPVLEDAVEAPSSTVKKDNGWSLGSAPASGAATWLAFLGGAAGVWLARRRRG
jgi:secreted trypsin-like serine protease